MTANWAVHESLSVVDLLAPTNVTDATPVESTDFDVRSYPGKRLVLVLVATETNAGNTGGVWTVVESATDGGTYTACTLGGALVATPASAGTNVQKVSVLPNPAKPFVHAVYTGADASAEVVLTVALIVVPTNI